METFSYEKVDTSSLAIAAGQPAGELIIKGNNSYEKLIGYIIIIEKADGSIYSKNVKVALANTNTGAAILPLQPYHCIRPSFAEKPIDRIIKTNEKAANADFRFRIEPKDLAEPITFTVVAYFTLIKGK